MRSASLLACALALTASAAVAQSACPTNYAQIIATKLGANTPLATGQLTVIATDASHNPINYSVPGIGVELTRPKRDPVVAGAITQLLCLPMSNHTSIPVGYHFNVRDTSPSGGNAVVLDAQDVAVTTDPFYLDTYDFLKGTDPYTLTSVEQTIGGVSQLTTDVLAQGTGTVAATVVAINGTSVPASANPDLALITTAIKTANWTPLPSCGDSTHALAYSTKTHAYSCQAIAASGGEPGSFYSSTMTSGTSGKGSLSNSGGSSSPNALAIAAANDANGIAVIDPLASSDTYDPGTLQPETRIVDNFLAKDLQWSLDPENYTGWGNIHHEHNCTTKTLPDDQGGLNNQSAFCFFLNFHVLNGGANGGSDPTSGGSLGATPFAINGETHNAGTQANISFTGYSYGAGDRNGFALEHGSKIATMDASGEGGRHFFRMHENSVPTYTGTVTGATDADADTTVAATCTGACASGDQGAALGVGHPLVNLSSLVQAKVSAVSGHTLTLTDLSGNPLALTPASGCSTTATEVDVPRGNLTGTEASTTAVSLTLNTAVAYNVDDVIDLSDGGHFRETARITSADALSGGTQVVGAQLRYTHPAGTKYCVNGFQGYIEDTKFPTTSGKHYYFNVDGALSASSVYVGIIYVGNYSLTPIGVGDTVNLYTGSEVVNVVNPATGKADGLAIGVEPTQPGTWTAGNSIMHPDHAGQSVSNGQFNNYNLDDPFAAVEGWEENLYGAGLNSSGLLANPLFYHSVINVNPMSLYNNPDTTKASYRAPNFFRIGGPWGNGFVWDNAPIGGNVANLGNTPFLLGISQGFADGSPLIGDSDYSNGVDNTGVPSHWYDVVSDQADGFHMRFNQTKNTLAISKPVLFENGFTIGPYNSLHFGGGNATQWVRQYFDYWQGTPGALCNDTSGMTIQCTPELLDQYGSDPTVNAAAYFPQANSGTDNIVPHDPTVPGLFNKGGQLWYQQPNGTPTPTQAKLPETGPDIETALGNDYARLVPSTLVMTASATATQASFVTHVFCSGGWTWTLPATSFAGQEFYLVNTGSTACTFASTSTNIGNGTLAASLTVAAGTPGHVVSDGTNWRTE